METPREALVNCVCIIRLMREKGLGYGEACEEVRRRDPKGRVLGTFWDSCTRFGKGGRNTLSVHEVDKQVESGEIVNTLIRKFPESRDWIRESLI